MIVTGRGERGKVATGADEEWRVRDGGETHKSDNCRFVVKGKGEER